MKSCTSLGWIIGTCAFSATIWSLSAALAEPQGPVDTVTVSPGRPMRAASAVRRFRIDGRETPLLTRFQIDVLEMSDEAFREMKTLLQIRETTRVRAAPAAKASVAPKAEEAADRIARVAVVERSVLENELTERKFLSFIRENDVAIIGQPHRIAPVNCCAEMTAHRISFRNFDEAREESPSKSPWRLVASSSIADKGRIHVDLKFEFQPRGAGATRRLITVDEELDSDQTLILTGKGTSDEKRLVMVLTASLFEAPITSTAASRKKVGKGDAEDGYMHWRGKQPPVMLIPTELCPVVPFRVYADP